MPANALDPLFPEVWAKKTLDVLSDELRLANLVYRDPEQDVARSPGDIVNVQAPKSFVAQDKTRGADYTITAASADNFQIQLNKHKHVTFLIEDVEKAWSDKELEELFIVPAARAIAEAIETDIGNLFSSFTTEVGSTGADLTEQTILEARHALIVNKAPLDGQWSFIIHPDQEIVVLQIARLTEADKVGDGSAIRQGLLGRRYDMQFYTSAFVPKVTGPVCHNALIHPQAIALVMRDLPEPRGLGVDAFTLNQDGYRIRVVRAYNAMRGGVQVTVETLYGVTVLRDPLGVRVLSSGK